MMALDFRRRADMIDAFGKLIDTGIPVDELLSEVSRTNVMMTMTMMMMMMMMTTTTTFLLFLLFRYLLFLLLMMIVP